MWREKCPYTELFLVRIFLYSDQITPYLDTFHIVIANVKNTIPVKKFLRNFAKLTGKHLCQNLFFNKFAGPRLATLLKTRLWHRCFPVNFAKFLRTSPIAASAGRLTDFH